MISLSLIVDLSIDTTLPILFRECSFVNCTLVGLVQLDRCVCDLRSATVLSSVNESCVFNTTNGGFFVLRLNYSSIVYSNVSCFSYALGMDIKFSAFSTLWAESCNVYNSVFYTLVCFYTQTNITLSYTHRLSSFYPGYPLIINSTVATSYVLYTQTFFSVPVPSVFSRVPSLSVVVSECRPVVVRVFVPVFAFACLLFE